MFVAPTSSPRAMASPHFFIHGPIAAHFGLSSPYEFPVWAHNSGLTPPPWPGQKKRKNGEGDLLNDVALTSVGSSTPFSVCRVFSEFWFFETLLPVTHK